MRKSWKPSKIELVYFVYLIKTGFVINLGKTGIPTAIFFSYIYGILFHTAFYILSFLKIILIDVPLVMKSDILNWLL